MHTLFLLLPPEMALETLAPVRSSSSQRILLHVSGSNKILYT